MTAIGTAAAVVDRLEPVPATFGAVFAVPEFRVLWLAQVLSVVGEQLARVALSVLTFHRTGSPLLPGAGYALSDLPAVAGDTSSPPRRPAVAAADGGLRPGADGAGRRDGRTGRAVLGALYAARRRRAAECAVRCGPGGAAARGAPGRPVRRCQCRQQRRHPGRPALGFAAGGGLAAVLGTSATLALDAVTFGASAGLLWLGLRPRPAPPGPVTGIRSGSPLRSAAAGARLVGSDARLRALVGCAWLGYFFVVPEGLAGPLRRGSWRRCWHRGPADGGAAGRRGRWRGAARPTRRPARRPGLMGPLAVLSCAPLLGGALHPGVVVSLALWAVSGLGTSYQLVANSAFVLAVPAACRGRGQAFGLVQSGIYAAQGAATLVAGAAAQCLAPDAVVVVATAHAGALGAA